MLLDFELNLITHVFRKFGVSPWRPQQQAMTSCKRRLFVEAGSNFAHDLYSAHGTRLLYFAMLRMLTMDSQSTKCFFKLVDWLTTAIKRRWAS